MDPKDTQGDQGPDSQEYQEGRHSIKDRDNAPG